MVTYHRSHVMWWYEALIIDATLIFNPTEKENIQGNKDEKFLSDALEIFTALLSQSQYLLSMYHHSTQTNQQCLTAPTPWSLLHFSCFIEGWDGTEVVVLCLCAANVQERPGVTQCVTRCVTETVTSHALRARHLDGQSQEHDDCTSGNCWLSLLHQTQNLSSKLNRASFLPFQNI